MKERIEAAIKTAVYGSIAAAAGIAAFVFLAIALFFWTQQRYDTIVASGAVGGLFFAVMLIALIALFVGRRRAKKARPVENAMPSWLMEPATLVAALQVVRTIGLGRLIPIALIGAVAAGFLSGGSSSKRSPGTKEDKRAA